MEAVEIEVRGCPRPMLVSPEDAWIFHGRTLRAFRRRRKQAPDVWYVTAGAHGRAGMKRGVVRTPPQACAHNLILPKVAGREVDHINGDGLDNRRCNLRYATRQQNAANGAKKGRSSRFKGVCFDKSRGKWLAGVKYNYVRLNLGRHATEEAAARAYDRKALELFGEFARTNFPRTDYLQPSP